MNGINYTCKLYFTEESIVLQEAAKGLDVTSVKRYTLKE